jgi:hypothetical protein
MEQIYDPLADPNLNPHAKGRDAAIATFGNETVLDEEKTRELGKPIHKEVPFVRIMIPGDATNIVHRPAKDEDKQRFFRQWKAFEDGQEQTPSGTKLELCPFLNPAQIKNLKTFKIHTVEQLAEYPETTLGKIPEGMELKHKAREFLSGSDPKVAELEAVVAQLQAQLASMERGPKRRNRNAKSTSGDSDTG